MRSRFLKLLALLLVLGLAAAACGNDDDGGVSTGSSGPDPTQAVDGGDQASTPSDGDGDEPAPPDEDDDGGGSDVSAPVEDDGASEPAMPSDEELAGGCEATVPGTKVNYAVFSPNSSMDPTASSGSLVGGTQLVNVWDVMMTFDPDAGVYNGHVAESLTPNDDFTQWTLKIPSGITYGNGDTLDRPGRGGFHATVQGWAGQRCDQHHRRLLANHRFRGHHGA